MYRSQLRPGDRLRFSDALVMLESDSNASTFYTDYEFYGADYRLGIFGLNALSSESVWEESLRGSFLSLLAIRFKAEHPDWDYSPIQKASDFALSQADKT